MWFIRPNHQRITQLTNIKEMPKCTKTDNNTRNDKTGKGTHREKH